MKKLILLLALATALPVMQTGCSTPVSERVQQVQTLKAVGHAAEAAVAASAQLYASGTITAKQAREVMDLYNEKFLPAFRIAANAVQSDLSINAPEQLVIISTQLSMLVASFSAEKRSQ